MSRNRTPVALLLSLIVFILFYGMGCSEFNSPVGDDSAVTDTPTLPSLDGLAVLGHPGGGEPVLDGGGNDRGDGGGNGHGNGQGNGGGNPPFYGEAKIDASGGSLTVGEIMIEVPPGAVAQGDVITLSVSIPDPVCYMWEIRPHDYAFQEDVTIEVPLDDADLTGIDPATDIAFYTWDESLGAWLEEGGTYEPNSDLIWIQVPHFSYWALASD